MLDSGQKFVLRLLLLLGAGVLIGWLYGRAEIGLLLAALLGLVWQVRQLLTFERALRTGDFDAFRVGEGIWQQMFSRFHYAHERGSRYKSEYRRMLKEIRKSTNAMPDGAVIIDAENEIIVCNRAAKQLAGLKRKKDRGQRVDNLLRDPGVAKLLRANDPKQSTDIASPVKDGAWLNCRVVPYGASEKLLLLRDVTERMALNKMRRDFVANASHELRSPLTVLTGYLDTMADDEALLATWEQPLAQMQVQASRMAHIVSELLELSRLEGAGRATTEEIIDICDTLALSRKAFQGRPDTAAIEIECESKAQLRGKSREIESVIGNLLSNALRHTPAEGRVTLAWRSGPDGADLVVTDTGEGIAEEHIPRLTERFFRVDRGRARTDGGVGLGLAIVKHVLTRHDAELQISSDVGAGSEFRCHFPAARVVVDPPVPLAGGSQSA
ncbi:MAG: phosphate regulon sensor histidine kinase PhoR [Gammaproteobacteria bacterium]|nr:phosphate regulon sensor histidine kinase PhoR [Gammaproteobacteria bacterium]MDH3375135.1 phosphate regulon sensor histidine kinase PhoR [Gammaproteobacteria bacterium]